MYFNCTFLFCSQLGMNMFLQGKHHNITVFSTDWYFVKTDMNNRPNVF